MSFNFSIVNNITADQVATQLNQNQFNLSNTIQQLSTGLRITSPAVDPAGNAIATRLQDKNSILQQGTQNAQNGVSAVQVAEGALTQVQGILVQMSSLAAEAADGSLSTSDRLDAQNEINQLQNEINQIVTETQFGNQNLIDGSIQGVQAAVASTLQVTSNAYLGAVGNSLINAVGVGATSVLFPNSNASCFLDETFRILIAPSTISASSFIVNVYASSTVPGGGLTPDVTPIATLILQPTLNISNATLIPITITSSAVGGATFVATLNFQGITVSDIANMIGESAFVVTQAYQPSISVNKSLYIQVGADVGNIIGVNAPSVLTGALFNQQSLNVTTQFTAEGVMNQVNHAINIVNTAEANLAAQQLALQALTQNNQVLSTNITAAASRITDVNVATATTQLTQEQILVQTATSMLSQANLQPQSLLTLFK